MDGWDRIASKFKAKHIRLESPKAGDYCTKPECLGKLLTETDGVIVCNQCCERISVTKYDPPTSTPVCSAVDDVGYLEGETCRRDGCQGKLKEGTKDEGCTCFLSAPCNSCMTLATYCPECSWEAGPEDQPY